MSPQRKSKKKKKIEGDRYHYIPQHILKNHAGPCGYLDLLNARGLNTWRYNCSSKSVGYKTFLVRSSKDIMHSNESWLAGIEGKGNGVLREILRDEKGDDRSRAIVVKEYVASIVSRNPYILSRWEKARGRGCYDPYRWARVRFDRNRSLRGDITELTRSMDGAGVVVAEIKRGKGIPCGDVPWIIDSGTLWLIFSPRILIGIDRGQGKEPLRHIELSEKESDALRFLVLDNPVHYLYVSSDDPAVSTADRLDDPAL